jgi:hypothetical protein
MTTFNDQVFQMGGAPIGMMVPFGGQSKSYFVDPQHGSNSFDGTTPATAKASLEAAYALTVADHNDTVYFIGGPTADNPAAEITWSNSYTHLIGLSADLSGLGQRCRVIATSNTWHNTITFSGNGCLVKNMQFNNEHATGTAVTSVTVTGQRCLFENVFFMVPPSVTAHTASLKVSGGENTFRNCTIGQQTSVRTAASHGLWLYKGDGDNQRNSFEHCKFLSWSGTSGHTLVYTDIDIDNEGFVVFFDSCLFANLESGAKLAVAIDDNCAVYHALYMYPTCAFAGCTAVGDPLTYILVRDLVHHVSGGLMATTAEA